MCQKSYLHVSGAASYIIRATRLPLGCFECQQAVLFSISLGLYAMSLAMNLVYGRTSGFGRPVNWDPQDGNSAVCGGRCLHFSNNRRKPAPTRAPPPFGATPLNGAAPSKGRRRHTQPGHCHNTLTDYTASCIIQVRTYLLSTRRHSFAAHASAGRPAGPRAARARGTFPGH